MSLRLNLQFVTQIQQQRDSYLEGMFWESRRAAPPASMGPPRLTHLYDGEVVARIESPGGRDGLRHMGFMLARGAAAGDDGQSSSSAAGGASGQTKGNFSQNTKSETSTLKKSEILSELKLWPKRFFGPKADVSVKNAYFSQIFQNIFHQN